MPRTKYCDKVLDRHTDPAVRRKIAKAKLKKMVAGKPTKYQAILLDTLVPLYLEIHEMSKHHGEEGFDMKLYLNLQNALSTMVCRYTATPASAREERKSKGTSQTSQNARGFDLGAIFGS